MNDNKQERERELRERERELRKTFRQPLDIGHWRKKLKEKKKEKKREREREKKIYDYFFPIREMLHTKQRED